MADNGAKKIFVFDSHYRPLFSFPVLANGTANKSETLPAGIGNGGGGEVIAPIRPSPGTRPPSRANTQVTCVATGMNEDILVGASNGVYLYDSAGRFVRTVCSTLIGQNGSGCSVLIGGIAVDKASGYVLATVSEGRGRTYVAVSSYKGELKYVLDSYGAKLKRPSGICLSEVEKNCCFVADLGNHSVKKYKFK